MLIKQEHGQYVVRLGTMGGEAMEGVVYKHNWFYAHLLKVLSRVKQNHVVAELNPTHQGRNEKHLRTIDGLNACGLFTDIFTVEEGKTLADVQVHIHAKLMLAGAHAQLVQAMLENDPEGWTWQFRMRALTSKMKPVMKLRHRQDRHGLPLMDPHAAFNEDGNPIDRRSLIPEVIQVITWDLHPKYD